MERKFTPERISSHPLLTPEKQAEIRELRAKLNTPEARAEQERIMEEIQEKIEMKNRVQQLEEKVRELTAKVEALTH